MGNEGIENGHPFPSDALTLYKSPTSRRENQETSGCPCSAPSAPTTSAAFCGPGASSRRARSTRRARSEEHTSELQSLMRSSYAVFCLKNKKATTTDKYE